MGRERVGLVDCIRIPIVHGDNKTRFTRKDDVLNLLVHCQCG